MLFSKVDPPTVPAETGSQGGRRGVRATRGPPDRTRRRHPAGNRNAQGWPLAVEFSKTTAPERDLKDYHRHAQRANRRSHQGATREAGGAEGV